MSNPSSSTTPEPSVTNPTQSGGATADQTSSPVNLDDVKIKRSRPSRKEKKIRGIRPRTSETERRDGGRLTGADENGAEEFEHGHGETSSGRHSGGFLLAPIQRFSKRRHIEGNAQTPDGATPDSKEKGKGKALDGPTVSGDTRVSLDSRSNRDSSSGYLSIDNIRPGKQNGARNSLSPQSTRESNSSRYEDSSFVVSSSSARGTSGMALPQGNSMEPETTPPPTIDPSQIVRMALSLNESRRLNLSPGRLASNPASSGRRVTSAGMALPPSALQGHFANQGGSLRQALQQQQQRRSSRNVSPGLGVSRSPRLGLGNSSRSPSRTENGSPVLTFEQDFKYTFSASTVSRAEKARTYIELSSEYRRLLDSLPPLKPAEVAQTRQLGRKYNPLQYIRNRKVRARQQSMLDAERDGWNDPDDVKAWIDSTERESGRQNYYIGDVAMLPPWNPFARKLHDSTMNSSPVDQFWNSPTGSKPKRPKIDWSTNPADFLADAYWLELENHKGFIENGDGNKIFPRFQRPRNTGMFTESPLNTRQDMSNTRADGWGSPESPPVRGSMSITLDESDTDGSIDFGANKNHPHASKTGKAKRRWLRRRRVTNTRGSFSSATDEETVANTGPLSKLREKDFNTAPLEKHMNKMIEDESLAENVVQGQSGSRVRDRQQARRGGVSENQQHQSADVHSNAPDDFGLNEPASARSSFSGDPPRTPRISIEQVDNETSPTDGKISSSERRARHFNLPLLKTKPRSATLAFLHRRGKSKQENKIDENDFALRETGPKEDAASPTQQRQDSARSSFESAVESSPYDTFGSPPESRRESGTKSQENLKLETTQTGSTSTPTRFFKGGRIGELVRSEVPNAGDVVFKQSAPRGESVESSKRSTNSPASESDGEQSYLMIKSREHRRTQSTNDLRQGHTYRAQNLPTFRSANTKAESNGERPHTAVSSNRVNQQRSAQMYGSESRRSRFDRLRPSSPRASPNMSPNTSSVDLTRYETEEKSPLTKANSGSRDVSPFSSGMQAVRHRLLEPGGIGRGGLPHTGLTDLDPRQGGDREQAWSIAERSTFERGSSSVTVKDIKHVHSLLLSSGVKAQAIVEWANEVRSPIPQFLSSAAVTANASVARIPRRQEHVAAARMLSKHLEATEASFENAASQFRKQSCGDLQTRIDDLRDRLNANLTPLIQSCGDDADGLMGRLTTTSTLAVKQVNDGVDRSMRSRRRRLRWIRRTGFGALEWILVGLMWCIWLFVLSLRLIRFAIVGTAKVVRWLIWV